MSIAMPALLLAWALDACFGELPNRWHPVAALGRVLGPIGRRISTWPPLPAFVAGAAAWTLLAASIGGAAWALESALARSWPALAAACALGLLLKPCFAWRMLRDEVSAVDAALGTEGLEAARARLARLVSRDVEQADAAAVREAAIETLAENLNDSVVAPLAWYAVLRSHRATGPAIGALLSPRPSPPGPWARTAWRCSKRGPKSSRKGGSRCSGPVCVNGGGHLFSSCGKPVPKSCPASRPSSARACPQASAPKHCALAASPCATRHRSDCRVGYA